MRLARWCGTLLALLPSLAVSCPRDWSLADWRQERADSFSRGQHFPRTLAGQVRRNAHITRNYALLAQRAHHPFVVLMGGIYAEGSHHLGRVVRAPYWRRAGVLAEELVRFDLSFLRGRSIGQLASLFPLTTALKLLDASEDLHHQLTAFLAALDACGDAHTATLVSDADLRATLSAPDSAAALRAFVRYEQRYLQATLYADWQVAALARQGVLDPMRFIPFAGEPTEAFDQWCRRVSCGQTSYDLATRVRFDQQLLAPELLRRSPRRWRAARLEETLERVEAI